MQRAHEEARHRKHNIWNLILGVLLCLGAVWLFYIFTASLSMSSSRPIQANADKAPAAPAARVLTPTVVEPNALRSKIVDKFKVQSPVLQQPQFFPVEKKLATKELPKESSINATVTFFADKQCKGEAVHLYSASVATDIYTMCGKESATFSSGKKLYDGGSILVTGSGDLDVYQTCNGEDYWASVLPIDGCVNLWVWPPMRAFKFTPDSLSTHLATPQDDDVNGKGKYVIAYSCESSKYFGYQAQSAQLGFERSKQAPGSRMIRLLTCSEPDDLNYIPTWNAKKHVYVKRYGPLNKPDVITKWFASPAAPKEDIVVVVDPDNWLIKSVEPWVNKVSKGHALSQAAFFMGATTLVTAMYKEFCTINCDWALAMAAVPYIMHRDDLAVVAPLWKKYTLLIKEKIEVDKAFEQRYSGVQIAWCAEMFAFIMGVAEAGVHMELVHDLQIRDVAGGIFDQKESSVYPMIHMGRAWFPNDYEPGKRWEHTEGRDFRHHGRQVWCKCNDTGSDIIPWPLPQHIDLVSEVTLTLLHDSREKYGELPINKYRSDYHSQYP